MAFGLVERNSDPLLAIAEGLDLVLVSADEVLVQFGTRSYPSELLRDTDLTGMLGAMIGRLLQSPTHLQELLSEVPPEDRADAAVLIDDLQERGTLTEVITTPVEQYLRYTFTEETTLADRSVGLIGAGPTGSRVAHCLLQHGLGRITLLDDRTADRLWHAFLPLGPAVDGDLAASASLALRDRLLAAGHSGVESLHAALDLPGVEATVARSDLVVLALEQSDLRLAHLVNRVCIRERKPWMMSAIDGNLGLVGPLFLPPHTACYNDYRTLADAATPSPEMARKHRQHVVQRGAGSFFPGLPAYPEIVAGHTALAVVHFLLRDTCFALGRVLVIDFDRMLLDVEDVMKLPRCPVCGSEKSAYRMPASVDLRVAGEAGVPAPPADAM